MSGRLTFFAIVLALATAARGQATRPALEGWEQTVRALATAVNTNDVDGINAVLAEHATIRRFSATEVSTAQKLMDTLGGRATISVHGYSYPPTAFAQDLSDDAAASKLPEETKKTMVLTDDEQVKQRASDTAVKWIGQTLGASKNDLIGIIVLWPADAVSGDAPTSQRPTFIVVKGTAVGDEFRITLLVHGDPLHG